MADLLFRFSTAERVEDCLAPLADSRTVANCAIVGFKEGYDGPAVASIPRPQYWVRKFGWPKNFLSQWLRINVAKASLMPAEARSQPERVTRWAVPEPETLEPLDEHAQDRAVSAALLLSYGIKAGVTATVLRPSGACGHVSWLKPTDDDASIANVADKDLLAITQGFFAALDRVRNNLQPSCLTPRELECLLWAAHGCRDKEIAQGVRCSHDTVRFHMKNIVRKLGASNRTHAVALGIHHGLVKLGGLSMPATNEPDGAKGKSR